MQLDRLANMQCLGCDTRAHAGEAALWGHKLAARAACAGRLLVPYQRGALGKSVGSRAGCMLGRALGRCAASCHCRGASYRQAPSEVSTGACRRWAHGTPACFGLRALGG